MALHQVLFAIYAIGCCAYALLRGGSVERIGAITNMAASVLSILAVEMDGWGPLNLNLVIIDIAVCVVFFILTSSNRFWPIWAFGFSLASVAANMAQLLPHQEQFIDHYARSEAIWGWPALAVLVIGTWRYRHPGINDT